MANFTDLSNCVWSVGQLAENAYYNSLQQHHFIKFTIIKSNGIVYPGLSYLAIGEKLYLAETWDNFWYPSGWTPSQGKLYGYYEMLYTHLPGGNYILAPDYYKDPVEITSSDYIVFTDNPAEREDNHCFNIYPYYLDSSLPPEYTAGEGCGDTAKSLCELLYEINCEWRSVEYPSDYYSPYNYKIRKGLAALNEPFQYPFNFDLVDPVTKTRYSDYSFISLNQTPVLYTTSEGEEFIYYWQTDYSSGSQNIFKAYKSKYSSVTGLYEPDPSSEFIIQPGYRIIPHTEQRPGFYRIGTMPEYHGFGCPILEDNKFGYYLSEYIGEPVSMTSLAKTVWTITDNNAANLDPGPGCFFIEIDHYLSNNPTKQECLTTELSDSILSSNKLGGSSESATIITTGTTLYIDDGEDVDNLAFTDWLAGHAIKKDRVVIQFSEVDLDTEWKNFTPVSSNSDDCHFSFENYANIRLNIYSGDIYNQSQNKVLAEGLKQWQGQENTLNISYYIGNTSSGLLHELPITSKKIEFNADYKNPIFNNSTRLLYKYLIQLSQSTIESDYTKEKILTVRDEEGDIPITIIYREYDENWRAISCSKSFKFPFVVAPDIIPVENNFKQSKVAGANNGDKILYYWDIPKDNPDNISLAGYCVEVERKVGENNWEKIRGLTFDDSYHDLVAIDGTTGITSYELLLDPDYKNPFEEAVPEGVETTFVSPSRNPGKDCEAYLTNYYRGDYHSFFFTPKGIGLSRGEEFRITIYPYVVYSQYWDENGQLQQSALLANAGTTLEDGKVSKGTVRVYYNNEWKEGQVWVYTGSGWKQAEAVYAYNDGAWKESQ